MHLMKVLQWVIFLNFLVVGAQKTLQLEEGQSSPKAILEDVAWITGHWQGEAFGGITEEIWSPPLGESMMFVFRLMNDGKVSFYEIGHIIEKEGTLLMRLKHFDGSLKGWEEKEETVDFKLVKLEANAVYFEGLTMKKINETQMDVYVLVESEGKKEEVLFNYSRLE